MAAKRTRQDMWERSEKYVFIGMILLIVIIVATRSNAADWVSDRDRTESALIRFDTVGYGFQNINYWWANEVKIGWGCDGLERFLYQDHLAGLDSCEVANLVMWGMRLLDGGHDTIPLELKVARLTEPWSDTSVTWMTFMFSHDAGLPLVYDDESVKTFFVGDTDLSWCNYEAGIHKVDITEMVQFWLANPEQNYGMVIWQDDVRHPPYQRYFHTYTPLQNNMLDCHHISWRVGCYIEAYY